MTKQTEIARSLRKRLTPQEVKIWVKLRELRSLGLHFRRQVPVGRYIVDFACLRSGLVVEIDGGQHNIDLARDVVRDALLQSKGFRVSRFWNSDVDHNLNGIIETIVAAAQNPHPARKRAPPSPDGGGIRKSAQSIPDGGGIIAASNPSPERGGWLPEGQSGGATLSE